MLLCFKGEEMAKQSSILETVLTLGGLLTGGPKGAMIGRSVGTLLGGGTFQDALSSGIGMLFQTDPRMAMAANVLGGFDSGGRGGGGPPGTNAVMNALQGGSKQGTPSNPFSFLGVDQPTQPFGIPGLFNTMIGNRTDNPLTALLTAYIQSEMFKNTDPFSKLQQQQFTSGERVPSYKGTPAPDYRYSGGIRNIRTAAHGGMIHGPGTGKSDSIPAAIYQGGMPVQEARLSNGEFVMTADAVKGAGGGDRAKGAAQMYKMMNQFEGRA